jgi:hypothetical protein
MSKSVLDFLKSHAQEKEKEKGLATDAAPSVQHLADAANAANTELITIAHCYPACPHCRCSWITELSDPRDHGRTLLRCWSCRRAIDGVGALLSRESVGEGRRLLAWTTGDGSPE